MIRKSYQVLNDLIMENKNTGRVTNDVPFKKPSK